MNQAARGAAALKDGNYDEAIKQYTTALSTHPNAVDYYIKRSTAYQRSSKYSEALADAEFAVFLAHKRAKRELIKESQLRRGIALFFLERYADAEFVLNIVKRLDEKEKTLAIWNTKVTNKLQSLEEGDERGKVTVKEVPDVELPSQKEEDTKTAPSAESQPTAPAPIAPTPASKIKHDWYQNNENVYFTLLARGVPKDKAAVDIDADSLSISFPIEGSSHFDYSLDPLFAKVDPSRSSYQVKASKVEFTLKKAEPGIKWKSLEGNRNTSAPSEDKPTIPAHVLASKSNEQPPSYPTSSKKGAKNWDTVVADDDLDDYDGDDTSRFFKQLYKGASADQQRAMMKSYQESGGTVLSTDWSNVGSRTVVPEPPDGMEAKKY
ncbi:SGS-domain-containing protein [Lojkania enalia]|uniref:SGS-domain-containing protein n=1 Tax=Lojkania enalia TaxID=147567 RepID=A0A9P4KGI2_9PLEO|nr:SGS-domain-containing protein [Didymosphaeria enalia]